MKFKDLYDLISRKLKINSDNEIDDIKDVINEQVKEFCRLREWENIKTRAAFSLDGSDSYSLDALLINRCTIKDIYIDAGGLPIQKTDYKVYRKLVTKNGFYAIMGDTLYLEGDTGDYEIFYTSFGGDGGTVPTDEFPLNDDDDEILATKHYWEIIKQLVVVHMLEQWGDIGTIELESRRLGRIIKGLQDQENRQTNNGKNLNLARH